LGAWAEERYRIPGETIEDDFFDSDEEDDEEKKLK
jgi:endogenous inhibitor of DNA gyrase (YacG/DUF329 family)